GRTQIHLLGLEVARAHLVPPAEEGRLPVFQRALQLAVFAQVDVVGDESLQVDAAHMRFQSNLAFLPVPKSFKAPSSPTALGRMKIQFCQAERRPNTRVSMVSLPGKRSEASMPVNASGDSEARAFSDM